MATSTPHCARRHASTFALELLAEEWSTTFDRSVVRAMFQIGWRDLPDATAAEWALLHVAELVLELRREAVSVGSADITHNCGTVDLAFNAIALSVLEPGSA